MKMQMRWMAAVLLAAVTVAGWLGWRGAQWRQAYYADMAGNLMYDVEMAHRQLVRATQSHDEEQRIDALSAAHGYLVSAHMESLPLMERLAPFRKGQVAWMPKHNLPMLLQHARDLSPDLPDAALQRRMELIGGLEEALRVGLTERSVGPGFARVVDLGRLKESLTAFFGSMTQNVGPGGVIRFEDEPNPPEATALLRDGKVQLRLNWRQTYRLFPDSRHHYMVLVRSSSDLTVRSTAGPQVRMGVGPFDPFTVETVDESLHGLIRPALPADWPMGSYQVIRVPEGLPQTLTFRPPAGAQPGLLLWKPGNDAPAAPISWSEAID